MELPKELADAIRTGSLRRDRGSWPLKVAFDAYGNPLETELGEVYDLAQMVKHSASLPDHFRDEYVDAPLQFSGPGGIPAIRDFTQIVAFAIAGDGAPFCLDYRDGTDAPSVLWWDDVYWRRVAPDFSAFLALFDLSTPQRPNG